MKLSSRIAVLMFLVLGTVTMVSMAVVGTQLKKHDNASMQQWSQTLTATLAESIADDTISGNVIHVREVLANIVSKHDDLEYAFLTDFDNRVFAYTFEGGFPEKFLELTRSGAKQNQLVQLDNKELHNFSYPLIDGLGAMLHIGITHQQHSILINDLLRTIVFSTLLVGIIGIILSIYMSRRMTHSIESIANSISAYGEGDSIEHLNTDQDIYEAGILAVAFRDMVEARQKAKHDKEVSEELLERVFDTTYTLMAYLDTSFNIIRVNQAYLDTDNKTTEEVIGRNYFDLYPAKENEAIFQQVLATGKPYFAQANPFEYGHNPERGISHWNWSLQPVWEKGEIIALLLVLVNVTDQIQAQEAILRNEEAMRSAQAIGHFGSWDWNILTGELAWSEEIYRIFGQQPQAFPADYDAFLEAVHPDDRDAVSQAVTSSVENVDIPYDIEHRLVRPDGEIRYVHEKGMVYQDDSGRAIRMLGVVHDITDRRQIEEALRSSIELNKTIISEAPVGIAIYETNGQCVAANKAITDMVGAKLEQVLQQNFHDIESWKVSGLYAIAQQVLKQNTTERQEFSLVSSFGKDVSIDTYLSRFENKGIPHLLLMLNDISERKQIMQELTQHKENLELLVSERTDELEKTLQLVKQENEERKRAELSLVDAKDEAERANQLKSEFLGRMSHELRTPMNAILGFSQLLETEDLSESQVDFVKEISLAGNHLLGLINEVLDLSSIEAGKFNLEFENCVLNDLVMDCVAMVHPMAMDKNILIDNRIETSENMLLHVDQLRFKEVLVNLLGNAVKYNSKNGHIIINSQIANKGTIRINVIDDGPGMTAEQQELVFEPFNRLGAEYSDIEGTGIGLSIAKKLVSLMHGRIGVQSIHGQGSTFWIEYSLMEGGRAAETAGKPQGEAAMANPISHQSVLYVEDNLANLRLVQRVFERLENVVLYSAPNAELGIELAKSRQPDLILLDINLPGMNGYEALSRLRNLELTSWIPVIAVSAAAMPRDIERGLAAGFRRYITKPIQIVDLIEAIKGELEQGRDRPVASA